MSPTLCRSSDFDKLLAEVDSSSFNRFTMELQTQWQASEAEDSLGALFGFILLIDFISFWFFLESRLNRLLSLSTFF
jgi:hypothetical protein